MKRTEHFPLQKWVVSCLSNQQYSSKTQDKCETTSETGYKLYKQS